VTTLLRFLQVADFTDFIDSPALRRRELTTLLAKL
jgi:hypothetical protein